MAGDECGQPGTAPGNGAGATGQPAPAQTFSIPTLPDIVGQVPGAEDVTGRLGLPQIPGVAQ